MMDIKDRYIQIKEAELHVRQLVIDEKPSAPVLVFLHDALGSAAQWKSFPDRVVQRTGLNAIIYDRQGHGKSSPLEVERNPKYLHTEALEVLPLLLKQMAVEDPILIGHSDGGTIALIHGAHYPVKAIITMAAHIFVEEITIAGIREANKMGSTLVNKLRKYHGDKAERLFDAWQEIWLDDSFRSWSIEKELPGITAPTLAIQGSNDQYGTLEQVNGILAAVQGRKEKLILKGTGHLPFKEAPGMITDEIAGFLNK